MWIPASSAETSLSRTARRVRPNRPRVRLASNTSASSTLAHTTQACHRVVGTAPARPAGMLFTRKARPLLPPSSSGNRWVSAGSPTASASVAPARYGPCSRAAVAPASAPATPLAAAASSRSSQNGHPGAWITSSAMV
ncbi:hypothetical protein GCM10027521_22280 [Amycolatopsis cihanbeyliensis]